MERLGIYVQVPFCQTKCTYCNFHTGVVAKERFAPYVAAVCAEIRGHRELLRAAGVDLGKGSEKQGDSQEWLSLLVDTVYCGGGTPSLVEAGQLQEILDAIREAFATALAEVTLEADPETIDEQKAAAWVAAGINRVSFGVQSVSEKELAAGGRMHRRVDILRAVPILLVARIWYYSLDLI